MSNEIEIGSEWVYIGGGVEKVVYVNARKILAENKHLIVISWDHGSFFRNYKPHIKPKPPVGVYAVEDTFDGEVKWFTKIESICSGWKRRPDLDREV